jgi:hypothetical protein
MLSFPSALLRAYPTSRTTGTHFSMFLIGLRLQSPTAEYARSPLFIHTPCEYMSPLLPPAAPNTRSVSQRVFSGRLRLYLTISPTALLSLTRLHLCSLALRPAFRIKEMLQLKPSRVQFSPLLPAERTIRRVGLSPTGYDLYRVYAFKAHQTP